MRYRKVLPGKKLRKSLQEENNWQEIKKTPWKMQKKHCNRGFIML